MKVIVAQTGSVIHGIYYSWVIAKERAPKDCTLKEHEVRGGLSFPMSSGLNPCGEIPLKEQEVCNLATGKLEVPHSACQHCGEVVNAVGEDRFGYSHPAIHQASSFGWSSEYFPINPSSKPKSIQFTAAEQNALLEVIHQRDSKENPGGEALRTAYDKLKASRQQNITANFQAECRTHRSRKSAATYVVGLSDDQLLKNLREKEQILKGLHFRCIKCGEPISVFHSDASGKEHECDPKAAKQYLTDDHLEWLIHQLKILMHPNFEGTPHGNKLKEVRDKLIQMELYRAQNQEGKDRV